MNKILPTCCFFCLKTKQNKQTNESAHAEFRLKADRATYRHVSLWLVTVKSDHASRSDEYQAASWFGTRLASLAQVPYCNETTTEWEGYRSKGKRLLGTSFTDRTPKIKQPLCNMHRAGMKEALTRRLGRLTNTPIKHPHFSEKRHL